jgi:hypothetical protein
MKLHELLHRFQGDLQIRNYSTRNSATLPTFRA